MSFLGRKLIKLFTSQRVTKMEYKQVFLARQDLKLPKGKLAVQVAHGAVETALRSDKEIIKKWKEEGYKKIVMKVENEKEIYKYLQQAKDDGLVTYVVRDAGKTVLPTGTVTVLAIGPDKEDKIDRITKDLKIM